MYQTFLSLVDITIKKIVIQPPPLFSLFLLESNFQYPAYLQHHVIIKIVWCNGSGEMTDQTEF